MGYVNYILHACLWAISVSAWVGHPVIAQTCCSGGVPLSGNIGFEGSNRGTLQMELGYDLNYISILKEEAEVLEDESRLRTTQSILWKTGYSITDWMAIDGLFTYVVQRRRTTFEDQVNKVQTNGLGDAVVIVKFLLSRISNNGTELQLGAGPKIPIGKTELTDARGITLNADLQPGSGSWDLVTWGYFARQLDRRPSMAVSARLVAKFNGANYEYLGSQKYRFGNSYQFYSGLGDQVVVGQHLFSISLSMRYRRAFADRINNMELDNTGGRWINVIPAIGWNIGPQTILNIIPEIPLFSMVDGVQLTPTFRIQAGIYHRFSRRNQVQINTDQL